MKKIILSAAVILFVSSSVSFAQHENHAAATSAPAAAVKKDGPVFKFEKEEYNFGTIKQGDKVEYSFEFVNSGKEALIITEAHGSCGCTVPEWPKQPLKKGEKGTIKVTFNSAGKEGMQDKTVTITSNAADSPKVLHIKGTVEKVAVAPDAKPAEAPKN
jgi:Protein of unknown function (DUF1573)